MARELLNVPPQIGYKQPYPMEMYQQNQYYAPAPIPQGNIAPGDIINALRQVQMNPGDFSKDEIEAAKQMSLEYFGKPLEFKDDAIRMGKNAAFDFVDTLAFGLIPDKIGPDKLTSSDEVAGMIGGTAGFFVPGIGPMATGTRLASKVLPSIAKMGTGGVNAVTKLAGEGAGKVVGEGASKALGGVTEWLGSQNAAARVGSMIGAGFNFEDGINPLGLALGGIFPMGMKGAGKSVSQAMDDAVKDVTSPTLKSLSKEELMAREVNALFPKNAGMVNVGTKQPIPSVPNEIPYTYHANPTVPGFAPATSPVSRFYATEGQPFVSKVDDITTSVPSVSTEIPTVAPITQATPPPVSSLKNLNNEYGEFKNSVSEIQRKIEADAMAQGLKPAINQQQVYKIGNTSLTYTAEQGSKKVTQLTGEELKKMGNNLRKSGIPQNANEIKQLAKEFGKQYPESTVADFLEFFRSLV